MKFRKFAAIAALVLLAVSVVRSDDDAEHWFPKRLLAEVTVGGGILPQVGYFHAEVNGNPPERQRPCLVMSC